MRVIEIPLLLLAASLPCSLEAAARMLHVDDEGLSDQSSDCVGPRIFPGLSPETDQRAKRFYNDVTLGHIAAHRAKAEEWRLALEEIPYGTEQREQFLARRRAAFRATGEEYARQIEEFLASVPLSERQQARGAVLVRVCVSPPQIRTSSSRQR